MQYYKTTYKLHNLFYDKFTAKEKFTENPFNRLPQTTAGQNK